MKLTTQIMLVNINELIVKSSKHTMSHCTHDFGTVLTCKNFDTIMWLENSIFLAENHFINMFLYA